MTELLALGFMRQALVAAVLVGLAAPLVGVFLVQRRLSLIGDGMGHVALAGVAVGVLTGQAPVLTALVAAVAAAVGIELIRASGRTSGDIALAVMFYGGIAAGVVIIAKSPSSSPANLTAYLFGAITTADQRDLWVFAGLALVVLLATWLLRPWLFAVANDEEYARASGLPVTGLNIALAVLTAVTVVVSMRVVGLLLISALMIIPNATAQLLGRSFRSSVRWAVLIGVLSSVGGVVTSFYAETPSGGTIVLLAIGAFVAVSAASALVARSRARRHRRAERHDHEHGPDCGHPAVAHGDHVDYLHGDHRHAAHEGHWDEHAAHEAHGDEVAADVVAPGASRDDQDEHAHTSTHGGTR
ncbi:metal ABC transporter permease [Pedococcus sp. NPDC057267]|uniref:metal ABC transporter permease n=1 Tax=Pedococcus sp. NPDC057267 TaxID=3346077 RepID=UPI00362F3877